MSSVLKSSVSQKWTYEVLLILFSDKCNYMEEKCIFIDS
jgi:hypothetical protein